MRPPGRRPTHRPATTPPISTTSLAEISREFDAWRKAQEGKPTRAALRDFWRARDPKHGPRPDYQLWRHLHCPDSPPEKRLDLNDLAARALKQRELPLAVPALVLVVGWLIEGARSTRALEALRTELGRIEKALTEPAGSLELWLAHVAAGREGLLPELSTVLAKVDPTWKAGRAVDWSLLSQTAWLPVPPRLLERWVITALRDLVKNDAAWSLTTLRMARSLRPAKAPARFPEIEMLLDTAALHRSAGLPIEALRLTALALHLLPERAPEALRQRCCIAAWFHAESGVAAPPGLRVSLDDLPFPGDGPATEKGQEAARLFRDDADSFQTQLLAEIETDADWQKLRGAGVVLHHPLAALAWIGKRAQSYALKKQQDVLQSAARLALRHQSLGTLARLRAEFPESAEAVIELARALRENQRRMPVLRDEAEWQRATACLRTAWGKLEPTAIKDEETLFFLHETLLDREVTLTRCLPEELRLLALKHLHGRRAPSVLVQALDEEPKLLQSLEHQRTVELWSISSEMRERAELAGSVWISLVCKGDAMTGKYSWIAQSATGRKTNQARVRTAGDLKPLLDEIIQAARELCADLRSLVLAVDATLLAQLGAFSEVLPGVVVTLVPGWEWAFRTRRDSAKSGSEVSFEMLRPEGSLSPAPHLSQPPLGPLASTCFLLSTANAADAATKWSPITAESDAVTRRSLAIGAHGVVISFGPVKSGNFKDDLVRLTFAQRGRAFLIAARELSADEQATCLHALTSPPPATSLTERVRALIVAQPGLWSALGVLE
jgi:hypothetical protein